MRTECINIFSFNELSAEAQQTAIENNRDIEVEFNNWYESTIEYQLNRTQELGFMAEKIYFSGFYSQGDGAMFKYSGIDEKLFTEFIDSLKISTWKKNVLKNCTDYAVNGRHSGRYYHEKSCDHYVEFIQTSGGDNIAALISKYEPLFEDFIKNKYESICKDIYQDLENTYDYLISDEAVKEAIEANELEFTEDGRPYKY